MYESSEKDHGKWRTIVFDEDSYIVLEQWTGANYLAKMSDNGNQE
jgi:hypothetical protein